MIRAELIEGKIKFTCNTDHPPYRYLILTGGGGTEWLWGGMIIEYAKQLNKHSWSNKDKLVQKGIW